MEFFYCFYYFYSRFFINFSYIDFYSLKNMFILIYLLIDLNLKKINLSKNIDYDKLIKATDGYSGADIANVCREAALMPMRRELKINKGRNIEELVNDPTFRNKIEAPIGNEDLLSAIGNISKSVSQKDLDTYDQWTKEFSSV